MGGIARAHTTNAPLGCAWWIALYLMTRWKLRKTTFDVLEGGGVKQEQPEKIGRVEMLRSGCSRTQEHRQCRWLLRFRAVRVMDLRPEHWTPDAASVSTSGKPPGEICSSSRVRASRCLVKDYVVPWTTALAASELEEASGLHLRVNNGRCPSSPRELPSTLFTTFTSILCPSVSAGSGSEMEKKYETIWKRLPLQLPVSSTGVRSEVDAYCRVKPSGIV
ncbi:hypothetical protein BD309DRAFT_945589 [Dichomitus squalens]|nr:hypothetical protein BD309DRAFT_945589 [Dichomitus squalens]